MKERIDILLVERRLVESKAKAQWLIRNGYALVDGIEVKKPGKKIENTSQIQLKDQFPYVSKKGLKLEAAIKAFSISVSQKVCADLRCLIGGFTDCLLKHGALKVYAIDTTREVLHPSLRCEKMKNQVIPLLEVDLRTLKELDELVDICTVDLTYSSLKQIFSNIGKYLKPNGDIIALVKPLVETKFKEGKKFDVIQNPQRLQAILIDLIEWIILNECYPYGIIKSPILGKGGTLEFLVHFKIDKINRNYDYNSAINKII